MWGHEILLCRRAIEPRYGRWTLPAGFMENGETTAQGAIRETLEEANARVELLDMYTLVNLPHISQIHIIYLARLVDLDFSPGNETLEMSLFHEKEVPWNDLAFRSVDLTLRHFFADRLRGHFRLHIEDLPAPK